MYFLNAYLETLFVAAALAAAWCRAGRRRPDSGRPGTWAVAGSSAAPGSWPRDRARSAGRPAASSPAAGSAAVCPRSPLVAARTSGRATWPGACCCSADWRGSIERKIMSNGNTISSLSQYSIGSLYLWIRCVSSLPTGSQRCLFLFVEQRARGAETGWIERGGGGGGVGVVKKKDEAPVAGG